MLLPTLLALASPIQTHAWTEEIERNGTRVRHLTATAAEEFVVYSTRAALEVPWSPPAVDPGDLLVRCVTPDGLPIGSQEIYWAREHPSWSGVRLLEIGKTDATGTLTIEDAHAQLEAFDIDAHQVNALDYRNQRIGIVPWAHSRLNIDLIEGREVESSGETVWLEELPPSAAPITFEVDAPGPVLVLETDSSDLPVGLERIHVRARTDRRWHATSEWSPSRGPLVLPSLPNEGALELFLSAPRVAGWERRVELVGTSRADEVLRLTLPTSFLEEPLFPIKGTALGPDGSPFANGEVQVELFISDRSNWSVPTAHAPTDEQGNWTAYMVAMEGEIDFGVGRLPLVGNRGWSGCGICAAPSLHEAEGSARAPAPVDQAGVDLGVLRLEPYDLWESSGSMVDVAGRIVRADGQPVEGAEVDVFFYGSALTDAQGRYELRLPDHLFEDDWTVTVSHPDHLSIDLDYVSELEDAELEMQPTSTLVTALRTGDLGPAKRSALLRVDGEFLTSWQSPFAATLFIRELAPGPHTLSLSFEDSWYYERERGVEEVQVWSMDFKLPDVAPLDIGPVDLRDRLRVLDLVLHDDAGEPLVQRRVDVVRLDTGEVIQNPSTNPDGRLGVVFLEDWGALGLRLEGGELAPLPEEWLAESLNQVPEPLRLSE